MLLIVDSLTGLTRNFAKKIGYQIIEINEVLNSAVDTEFFLLTRCEGFGNIPSTTIKLLEHSASKCIGVAVSGNRNWGKNFGIAGDKIQNIYHIPLVCKFEGSGFEVDVNKVISYIKEYNYERYK